VGEPYVEVEMKRLVVVVLLFVLGCITMTEIFGCTSTVEPSPPAASQPVYPSHTIVLIAGYGDSTRLIWMDKQLYQTAPHAMIVECLWNDHSMFDRLADVTGSVVIVGHSFGGDEATKLARRMTNARVHLVLIDPVNEAFWWTPISFPFSDPNVVSSRVYMRSVKRGLPPFPSPLSGTKEILVPADHQDMPKTVLDDMSWWIHDAFKKDGVE
jgi:pimeloyl-ACP methyl ester carboxylesterase